MGLMPRGRRKCVDDACAARVCAVEALGGGDVAAALAAMADGVAAAAAAVIALDRAVARVHEIQAWPAVEYMMVDRDHACVCRFVREHLVTCPHCIGAAGDVVKSGTDYGEYGAAIVACESSERQGTNHACTWYDMTSAEEADELAAQSGSFWGDLVGCSGTEQLQEKSELHAEDMLGKEVAAIDCGLTVRQHGRLGGRTQRLTPPRSPALAVSRQHHCRVLGGRYEARQIQVGLPVGHL